MILMICAHIGYWPKSTQDKPSVGQGEGRGECHPPRGFPVSLVNGESFYAKLIV